MNLRSKIPYALKAFKRLMGELFSGRTGFSWTGLDYTRPPVPSMQKLETRAQSSSRARVGQG